MPNPPNPLRAQGFGRARRARARRRDELREMIAERRAALDSHSTAADPVDDTADAAFHRASADVERGLIDHYLREVAQIEAAEARAGAGTFGTCADCGLPIGESRLEANPVALRCLECQERHERVAAQSAPGTTQP